MSSGGVKSFDGVMDFIRTAVDAVSFGSLRQESNIPRVTVRQELCGAEDRSDATRGLLFAQRNPREGINGKPAPSSGQPLYESEMTVLEASSSFLRFFLEYEFLLDSSVYLGSSPTLVHICVTSSCNISR